jgi:threonine dehydratase
VSAISPDGPASPAFPFAKIELAAERLKGHAHVTPVHTSRELDRLSQSQTFLKCENFQRTGAFKFRGAFNAVSSLTAAERARGVLTYSSGNHAQALALVGQLFSIPITVVMPNDAPAIKRAATAAYGARIISYDPDRITREQLGGEIAAREQLTLIPPYDHAEIVAGQGTAVREFLQQAPGLDLLLVPCGGGGLLSGSAIAAKALAPQCRVVGIEPELADDATRSFRTGVLHTVHHPPTIADGTRTPSLGTITFPLVRQYVDDMQTVSEDAIKAAVRFLFLRMKLVVEPSGALGIAVLLSGQIRGPGRIGVVISGGNLDPATAAQILPEP